MREGNTLRKKRCPMCGELKWRTLFYDRRGKCKECVKRMKREEYARTRKVPDGIRIDHETGRKTVKKGSGKPSVYWDGNMLSIMRNHYPTTTNDEMVELLGGMVSKRTMERKAREMGLMKDPEWLRRVWNANRLIAQVSPHRRQNLWILQKGRPFTGNQYVDANRKPLNRPQ